MPPPSRDELGPSRPRRFSGIASVDVEVARGRIELGSRSRPDVRVRTTVVPPGRWGRLFGGRQPEPTVEQVGDRLHIRAARALTRVQLDLPDGTTVRARVGTGELTLWGVGGRLDLAVGEGTLAGRELTAPVVRARNEHGEANLHFVAVPAEVDASTHQGAVLLVLPEGVYRLDADAEAEVDVATDLTATAVVRAHSGTGPISVLTTAGSQPI